jgi:hypothetical protein
MVQRPQADLLQVVLALRTPGRLAGRLNRRQQERYQYSDNGDYDQQFHQGKSPSLAALTQGMQRLHSTILQEHERSDEIEKK